jgi:hypothetical protein
MADQAQPAPTEAHDLRDLPEPANADRAGEVKGGFHEVERPVSITDGTSNTVSITDGTSHTIFLAETYSKPR